MPGWLHALSLLLALAWAGVIFFLSSQPGTDTPLPFPHMDKLLHGLVFGILGLLVLGAMRSGKHGHRRTQVWTALAIAGSYGVLDEIHQHFVPGRMPDAFDVLADLTGAALGIWLLHTIIRRRYRG
jgi:VanZ family protein